MTTNTTSGSPTTPPVDATAHALETFRSDRLRTVHNGTKAPLTFSGAEFDRRLAGLRSTMTRLGVDAVVLTDLLLTRDVLDQDLWDAFHARRHARATTVVEASNQLAQWQLDHVQGDIPGLMRSIAQLTSQPA